MQKQNVTAVAAYCRVSTDKKDQIHSFAAQKHYFEEYIKKQDNWKLYKIYADEGITGTSVKKRAEFLQMIEDAKQGEFQLIITKEVSRFARNTLDAIYYTRELRDRGIGVLFLTDGIHTMEADSELRLSILGSIAQEESRRTSQRVKWGQTRQMETGVVFGHSLLGYDLCNGVLSIEPQGAEIVRLIFQRYGAEKYSSSEIARELKVLTNRKWSSSQVIRVLKNEKYVGDLVQKKTYTPNYLTHEKRRNNGAEPMIAIRDNHPAIIDRTLWDMTQTELQRRSRRSGRYCSNQYGFSGKIFCGKCGCMFIARMKYRKDGSAYRFWRCKGGCGIGKTVGDDLLKRAVITAVQMSVPDFIETEIKDTDLFFQLIVAKITVYPDRHLDLLFMSQKHPIPCFFV